MKLLEALHHQPVETREALLADNDLLTKVRERLQSTMPEIENINPWLTDLFTNFLPNLQPTTTILCLGSGLGVELLHLRNLIPEGVLFAADKKISENSVITEILTEATFIHVDFTTTTPKKLFEEISLENQKIPEVVICRHPDVQENPWWPEFLAQWTALIEQGNLNQLLITNYSHEVERLPILKAMNSKAIIPQVFSYDGGKIMKVEHPDYPNGIFRSDNYITVYPPLP